MLHSLMFYLYSNLPLSWGVRSYLARFACPDNEPLHFHHDGCPACDQLMDYGPAGGDWGALTSGDNAGFVIDMYDDVIEDHHFTEPIDCYSGVCDCVDK